MTKDQGVIRITMHETSIMQIHLNRPDQLNALSHEVLVRLHEVLIEAKQNKAVRAILLTGEGKVFCAGADIKQLASLSSSEGVAFATFGQKVFNTLEQLGKPSLAAIHGVAFGGGCELAMAATLRIAANTTVFSQPEIKLGVMPGFGGTQRLSRLIGLGRALDLCLTGRRFSAEDALQWGLLSEVTTPDTLTSRAMSILHELTQLAPIALENIMSAIHQGYNLPLAEALSLEAANFGLCCATADKQEGVQAFLEKRPAKFSGA